MLTMITKFFIFILTVIFVFGQNCTLQSGKAGYCREKGNCFGPYEGTDCQSGLICCHSSGKSFKKCHDYGIHIYRRSFNAALTARALVHNASQCSIEAIPLIVGGVKAKPKEFPHMVAIGYGKTIEKAVWMCGGSLISETFVLTAAHCSQTERGEPARFARLGALVLQDFSDSNRQDFFIAKIINHPKYKPPSRYNDIALYKLSESVEINSFVRPACLHTSFDEFILRKGIATGWGKKDYYANKGSEYLMKVALDFIDYPKCNTFFTSDLGGRSLKRGIISSQICAGVLQGGKDTCQGDSGGPLQIVKDDPYCMYSIVGITSFGKFCGYKNSPAVYTRVSHYVPWIESVVWE